MDINWNLVRHFAEATISIFAIVNPVGGLPALVGLTEHMPPAGRRRVLRLAGLTALVVIVVMALVGQALIDKVFHVTMDQFTFAGGLVLMIIGIRSLLGGSPARPQAGDDPAATRHEEIALAVSPIAMPLLAGPGSILTVIVISQQMGHLFALLACLAAFVFILLILSYAHVLFRLMGRVGSLAVGQVLQIFIVAIGARFVFGALANMFPGLLR